MGAQAGEFVPAAPRILGPEKGGVFDASIDRVGIGARRLKMPDALELPRMGGTVIPLVGAGYAVIEKLVPDRLPGPAAVIRSLNQLPEPARALRSVEPIGIGRRAFEVINLPAAEMRPGDVPPVALPVRTQDERALARPDEHPHATHG